MVSSLRIRLLLFVALFATPLAAQPLADKLDGVLASHHETRGLNGVVLVAQEDSVLYERGFGEADMAWSIPNAPDTRFRIGSVTKQFTSALILLLAEEGLLDVQGRVRDYLPEYAGPGADVTLHHLMTHTSGIPNYTSLTGFMQNDSRNPYDVDSLMAVFSDLDLEFEPGSSWNYSNSGYILLGAVIEAVTGKTYDEVLDQRLLLPLGLHDSGYDHYSEVIERRAEGYERAGGGYVRAAYLDTSVPYAAGMMYSTARDLHAWNRALFGGSVFAEAETLERMLTPYESNYGYGVGVADVTVGERSVAMVRHGGGINGFSAQLWHLSDDDYTIVVLDNTAANSGAVADALARVLYDQSQNTPKRSIADAVGSVIDNEGLEAAVAWYHRLKTEQPDAYDFGENELNSLGYFYLRGGDVDTALRIFQLNVEVYPEASNPYDSLGEAYAAAGDTERAIENYRKALELNPGSSNARQMLERLGVTVAPTVVSVPTERLESYVGRYQLQPSFAIEITREGDRLYAQATGQGRFEIFASSPTEFYLTVVDAQITFNLDEAGEVESLTLHQNGQHMPAPKVQ